MTMRLLFIRRLFWHGRYYAGAIGWTGMTAVALFGLCAAFVFFALKPLQAHIAMLQLDTAHLRVKSKITLPNMQTALNPAEQLSQFYRFFPKQDTLPDWMAKLYDAAAQQGLTLTQGEYRFTHDRNGKLMHYDIVLPAKGSYFQVRKFLAQALREVPNLALDGISVSRQRIDEAAVDVQLKFTLYLGEN